MKSRLGHLCLLSLAYTLYSPHIALGPWHKPFLILKALVDDKTFEVWPFRHCRRIDQWNYFARMIHVQDDDRHLHWLKMTIAFDLNHRLCYLLCLPLLIHYFDYYLHWLSIHPGIDKFWYLKGLNQQKRITKSGLSTYHNFFGLVLIKMKNY